MNETEVIRVAGRWGHEAAICRKYGNEERAAEYEDYLFGLKVAAELLGGKELALKAEKAANRHIREVM